MVDHVLVNSTYEFFLNQWITLWLDWECMHRACGFFAGYSLMHSETIPIKIPWSPSNFHQNICKSPLGGQLADISPSLEPLLLSGILSHSSLINLHLSCWLLICIFFPVVWDSKPRGHWFGVTLVTMTIWHQDLRKAFLHSQTSHQYDFKYFNSFIFSIVWLIISIWLYQCSGRLGIANCAAWGRCRESCSGKARVDT